MVVNIQLFRTEEGRAQLRESQRKRFQSVEIIDEIAQEYEQLVQLRFESDKTRKAINQNKIAISKLKRAKQEADDEIAKDAQLRGQLEKDNDDIAIQLKKINKMLEGIGNLVHDSVPVFKNEENNQVIRSWIGDSIKIETGPSHHVLLKKIGGYDQDRGVKIAGHRGYFLTGIGVKLNLALQKYAIDFLERKGYQPLQTPYMMVEDMMGKTAELADYNEALYNVEDKYLIATSEQPISAFHAGETLEKRKLPLKYAGISTCFRKEAGAHGKENWGIFRVHQFEKIEQFCITMSDESWEMHEEMIKVAEEFYQSLDIPYQIVSIVSGGLNNAAAKKYDLEAWFPSYGAYRELVSCSNCTDYQARNLNVRLEQKIGFVHMLNGTLCATERTICCILENYYTPSGIIVPAVLQPYLNDLEFIDFIDN